MTPPINHFSFSIQELAQRLNSARKTVGCRISNFFDEFFAIAVPDLDDKFAIKADELTERLSAPEQLEGKKEYLDLSKRVTEAVLPWLDLMKKKAPPVNPSEEALLSLENLAKAFQSNNKAPKKVWKELCPEIQNLFSCLLPHCSFPGNLPKDTLSPDEVESDIREKITLRFDDGWHFEAKLIGEGTGIKRFALSKNPEIFLTAISSVPPAVADLVNRYIQTIPPSIDDLFAVSTLKNEIQDYADTPHLQREIAAKNNHNILVAKTWYLQMLLETLGVATDRPEEYSPRGDWHLSFAHPPKPLDQVTLAECTSAEKKMIAREIRAFFEIERRYGLEILAFSGMANPKFENIFLYRDGKVFLSLLKNPLGVIEEDIASRHKRLVAHFEKTLDKDFFTQIFGIPFHEPLDHLVVAEKLGCLIELGAVSKEALFSESEFAKELLTCMSGNSLAVDALKKLPWKILDTPEKIVTCLTFCKALGNCTPVEPNIESVSKVVSELLMQIPSGLFPHESPAAFLKELPAIIEKDEALREEIFTSVLSGLFYQFLDNPDVSFEAALTTLIESVEIKLQAQVEEGELFIPHLEEQKISSSSTTYSYSAEPENLKPYLYNILWMPLIDRINGTLFPEQVPFELQDRLTLIRSALNSSDNTGIDREEANEKILTILHSIMISREKKQKAARILDRLNAYCE